ncbi:MAG: DUF1003 domain-containing protein [Patescibacteria group bacterium]|nr:DUF1003 domain-containing protein [Patescibacteria group bacterium]
METRQQIHEPETLGERIADGFAAFVGSWTFIIAQTVIVGLWIALNAVAFVFHWDPYPFILLNLAFSTQAAYCGPILLLASNRQSQRDREIAARDDAEIGEILALLRESVGGRDHA